MSQTRKAAIAVVGVGIGKNSFHAELMRMWLISARVNKPDNDEPSIL